MGANSSPKSVPRRGAINQLTAGTKPPVTEPATSCQTHSTFLSAQLPSRGRCHNYVLALEKPSVPSIYTPLYFSLSAAINILPLGLIF